jgi:hypothetical protein
MSLLSIFGRGGPLYTPDALLYRLGDDLNAAILVYAGVCGLRSWRRFRGGSADAEYWLLAGLGMLYLAVDELFSLHESLGEQLWEHGWTAPNPPFTHNDDAILCLVALGGVCVTATYFQALLEHRRAALLLLAGMVVTGGVIVMDWLQIATIVEESTELLAALILAAAFATRLRSLRDVTLEATTPAPAAATVEVVSSQPE